MDKIVKNILTDWDMDGNRVCGKVAVDQPEAFVKRGGVIVTSPVIRMFRVDGTLHLETNNSLYILA